MPINMDDSRFYRPSHGGYSGVVSYCTNAIAFYGLGASKNKRGRDADGDLDMETTGSNTDAEETSMDSDGTPASNGGFMGAVKRKFAVIMEANKKRRTREQ